MKARGVSCGRVGFTLVELAIVVVIIGLLAAVSLPKIDITRYRVDGAMRRVGSTLPGVQRLAVVHQHDVILQFDLAAQSIRIHEDRNNNRLVDAGERIRALPLGEHVLFGRGSAPAHSIGSDPVSFRRRAGGLPAVTFHRNGSASEFGGIYLTSPRATSGGLYAQDTRLIQIDRATGRTSWFQYTPGGWRRGF